MFEVKRKPDKAHLTAASTAVTTARLYPQARERALRQPGLPLHELGQPAAATLLPTTSAPVLVPPTEERRDAQTRLPAITGEIQYRGMIAVDGFVSGQLGASNSSLSVRQKSKAFLSNQPEFSGEISFRDMVRVNGFIAGTVYSKTGTLIVDTSARVDANVEVGVAVISGSVTGDIVAHERVELGPNAKIHGNIWTRSIEIKNGAIFEGICRMIEE
jgi:cytoskeletal protein CcmA (bactofilin family)